MIFRARMRAYLLMPRLSGTDLGWRVGCDEFFVSDSEQHLHTETAKPPSLEFPFPHLQATEIQAEPAQKLRSERERGGNAKNDNTKLQPP
ncbi:hypothetical protein B0T16DRAFT_94255 [Cercophora newfieldiana]|uniref:Uncharacterized protein n=1 Tax=Cercophora newfieldiana TaxID=92897 RepID=A0AA39YHJ7_9PEZI|nr:hypothetical protein B0T16DRAFT_94255 [Cercophora newfieldiana]